MATAAAPFRDDEPAGPPASSDELALVQALRAGDETAFNRLVEMYHAQLVRLALAYVADRATAEEVTQEAWLGLLKGLDRFEGRSSLKTWLFRILANIARTRGSREARSVAFSDLGSRIEEDEPAVDPDRFLANGMWSPVAGPSKRWEASPEEGTLSGELLTVVRQAIEALPPNQREVIRLRDIEGWSAEEICNVLSLTETNQRVLLHRARSKVRRAVEEYMEGSAA